MNQKKKKKKKKRGERKRRKEKQVYNNNKGEAGGREVCIVVSMFHQTLEGSSWRSGLCVNVCTGPFISLAIAL